MKLVIEAVPPVAAGGAQPKLVIKLLSFSTDGIKCKTMLRRRKNSDKLTQMCISVCNKKRRKKGGLRGAS